jgi:chorismate mutase/prephenate dehydratase
MTAPDDSPPETLTELAHVRRDIEAIDRRIIGLLAERLALGKRTAALKHASGLPILDAAREAEVIRRSAGIAREHGVPAEPVREIFWHIVGMSRRMQERDAAP